MIDRRSPASTAGCAVLILVDGFVRGTWRQDAKAETPATLLIALFDGVAASDRREVEAEAARVPDFLADDGAMREITFREAP